MLANPDMTVRGHSQPRVCWRTIVRLTALLFLVLTAADLTVPRLCREIDAPLFRASPFDSWFATSDDRKPTSSEDCFCCCSHIMRSEILPSLSPLLFVSDSAPACALPFPVAPASLHFRPPRAA